MAKRRAEIKLVVWLLTTKNRESFYFLACRWHATYRWKALDKGYNFFSEFISIRGLHTKLWASKVAEVLILRISGLSLGNPETKWCLAAGPMAKHRVYYKGEGDGFPPCSGRGEFCEFVLLVASPCTKMLQLRTNQLCLVCAGLCEWLNCLSIFLIPSRSSSMPLYPRNAIS
jgi:hypothetical protein